MPTSRAWSVLRHDDLALIGEAEKKAIARSAAAKDCVDISEQRHR
jgi:hypothetical protein